MLKSKEVSTCLIIVKLSSCVYRISADRGTTRDGWKLGASACSLLKDVTYIAFVLPVISV